jgi:hypothetical protein
VGRIYSSRSRRDIPAWWCRCLRHLPRIGDRRGGVEIVGGDALEWLPLLEGPDALFGRA